MSRLTRGGIAEPVSRDEILRHERRKGNIHFTCSSADHVQDWQPYPVDPYSCYMCDHTRYARRESSSQKSLIDKLLHVHSLFIADAFNMPTSCVPITVSNGCGKERRT